MTLAQASTLRRWMGAAGAVMSLLFLLSLFDALTLRLMRPSNYFPCVAGQSMAASGHLYRTTGSVGELTYLADSEGVRVVFDDLQRGFWSGEPMWRGRIVVSSNVKPGRYEVSIPVRDGPRAVSPELFRVEVYADPLSLRKSSPSFLERHIGVSPWTASLLFSFLIVLTFGAVFFLSQTTSRLMEREGRAEIWRVSEGERGHEIYFDLGLAHGIRRGETLSLFDDKRRPLGSATVQEVFPDHSIALAGREFLVRPGFVVSRST